MRTLYLVHCEHLKQLSFSTERIYFGVPKLFHPLVEPFILIFMLVQSNNVSPPVTFNEYIYSNKKFVEITSENMYSLLGPARGGLQLAVWLKYNRNSQTEI